MALPKVIIKNGAVNHVAEFARLGSVFTIITDAHLKSHVQVLLAAMREKKLRTHLLVLPPGEQTKSLTNIEKIASSLVRFGMKRDSILIALGGGVVGDITGFMASIYMRGISYVNIPTTLLAMCDSSIGGKTGVDLREGKNLVGTFYHPQAIVIDPLFLRQLPGHAFRSGMAEVIKHAIIADKTFFTFLEKNATKILARNTATLEQMIKRSVAIKMRIVRADERESLSKAKKSGVSRMLVNYGHTVGHALEKLSNYTLSHGDAVSIGMVAENRVALGNKMLKDADALRIEKLLKAYGLPTRIPSSYDSGAIKKVMNSDKKYIDGKLYFALPTKIGKAKVVSLKF